MTIGGGGGGGSLRSCNIYIYIDFGIPNILRETRKIASQVGVLSRAQVRSYQEVNSTDLSCTPRNLVPLVEKGFFTKPLKV